MMSDDFVDDGLASPEDFGQAVADGVEQPEPDGPILDLDEFADYRIPVKIDGEEVYVPLKDAREGFMRHGDYTRKTQELASQRNDIGWGAALKAAIEEDPAATIQMLAQHYGVNSPEVRQAQQQAAASQDDEFDWLGDDEGWSRNQPTRDPRLDEIAKRLDAFEAAQQQQRQQAELARLGAKYPDFDPYKVVEQAIKMRTNDFETAYKQMNFDALVERNRRLEEELNKQKGRQAAKQAATIVSGGSSGASSANQTSGVPTSIAEAYRQALRDLGG